MMQDIDVLYIITVAGTFAFAVSGALVAYKKHMDAYGMFILAFVTAAGGGTLRDIMLGRLPPFVLTDGMYALMSLLGTIVVLFMNKAVERRILILNVSDAIGLGVFTCIGASVALSEGIEWYGVVLLGTMTATVGGMLRDLLAQEVPFVLQKEIYASASVLGGFIFLAFDSLGFSFNMNVLLTSILTTSLRLCCMYYDVQLPKWLKG